MDEIRFIRNVSFDDGGDDDGEPLDTSAMYWLLLSRNTVRVVAKPSRRLGARWRR